MSNYKTENEKDLDQVFKMNEITQLLKLTPRTVRYYESEGLLGEVKRSIGFTRYFTDGDIERLKEVISLKKQGIKLQILKKYFQKNTQ